MLAYLEGYASLHESQELKLKRQNAGKEHSSSQKGLEGDRKGGGKRQRKRDEKERERGKVEEKMILMLSRGMDQYCPSFAMYNETSKNK